MEEAIASSQMEGASTTRKVAKDMLRKQIKPINKSQQMIANNYATIQYLVEHKGEDFSKEALLNIHHLISTNTLERTTDEGAFRTDDSIMVMNNINGEVVHTPPSASDIEGLIVSLCSFANGNSDGPFIHPIIKGIIIHFMLAYIHPFVDGNGRTARSLIYWYLLKNGYWLTEYLSISRVIYRSKARYEKAFLCYFTASAKGEIEALWRMGTMYLDGRGTEKDEATAYNIFMRAAKQGNSYGYLYLGHMYEEGIYVEENIEFAAKCYEKAAELVKNILREKKGEQHGRVYADHAG